MLSACIVSLSVIASEEESDEGDVKASKTPPAYNVLDLDQDGQVSKQEFDDYRNTQTEEGEESRLSAFASFDKDRDGFVSESELQAHAKYSNPGNGTGELKTNKHNEGTSQSSSNRGQSGKSNRGGGNGNNGNKGGKNK